MHRYCKWNDVLRFELKKLSDLEIYKISITHNLNDNNFNTYRSQGKCIWVTNEKIDSDDEVAKFFDKSADSESPNSSKKSAADTLEKVSVSHFSCSFLC